ncbi:MAG: hypothetical protein O2931_03730 [Planctomycetota bacterium]|nr:hypothetical protein [Planctomycetota bacterium]
MTDDLSLQKSGNIAFQVVIFRDEGAPSGAISYPLQVPERGFTNDREAFKQALSQVEAETGAPYFPEQVDVGVNAALRDLKWTEDKDTSKWIFLFTDAPPFEPNFDESNNKARRHVDTQVLIDSARDRGIRINTILCTSREEDRIAYERGLDQTRSFLNQLTNGTEGVMLDLSYPDIRRVLEAASHKPVSPVAKIGAISRQDIESVRQAAVKRKDPVAQEFRIRLAILPHTDLNSQDQVPSDASEEIATELREKWRRAGAEVANPRNVQQALRSLSLEGVEGTSLVQALGNRLKVDYVVWGDYSMRNGVAQLESALYDPKDGQAKLRASQAESASVSSIQLTGVVTQQMISAALDKRQELDQRLVAVLAGVRSRPTLESGIVSPVAGDAAERSHVLMGLHQLELALSYPVGSDDSLPLLNSARESLEKAVGSAGDPRNAWAQLLLTSCYYNLWFGHYQRGDGAEASRIQKEFQKSLSQAYNSRNRKRMPLPSMQEEIMADYALLKDKDYPKAIGVYEKLALLKDDPNPNTALRAHWMLVGIYAGDWQVPSEFVDVAKARQHLQQILAHWPDRLEAKYYASFVRADQRVAASSTFLPLANGELANVDAAP